MGFKEWLLNGPEPWLDPNHPNANRKFSVIAEDSQTPTKGLMLPDLQRKVKSYGFMFVEDPHLQSLRLGLDNVNFVLDRSLIPGVRGVRVAIWMQSGSSDWNPVASIEAGDGQETYLYFGNPFSQPQPLPTLVS